MPYAHQIIAHDRVDIRYVVTTVAQAIRLRAIGRHILLAGRQAIAHIVVIRTDTDVVDAAQGNCSVDMIKHHVHRSKAIRIVLPVLSAKGVQFRRISC